jgi:hypothetical protein
MPCPKKREFCKQRAREEKKNRIWTVGWTRQVLDRLESGSRDNIGTMFLSCGWEIGSFVHRNVMHFPLFIKFEPMA